MRLGILVLCVVGLCGSALAEKIGASVELGGGLSICQDNGDFKCDQLETGAQFEFSVGYRFVPYFGLTLDLNYGWLSHEDDAFQLTTLHLLPTFKLYRQFSNFEAEFGIGIGYARNGISGDDISDDLKRTATTIAAIKLGTGLRYLINSTLSAGLTIDYLYNGEMNSCGESDGPANCVDTDAPGLIQIGLQAGYHF